MNILKGPADADHYRVQVGRFGERWYTDPLPGTVHFPTSDATYPSISTIKKASGQDWSFVSLKRVADAGPDRLRQVADLADGERYDAIKSMNQRGLEAAAQRGTNVHAYIEARLRGLPPMLITEGMPGFEYIAAVEQFLDTYQPELVAAEFVVIHRTLNGVGYGGTPDAKIKIQGDLFDADWKTRTATSNHGAYPEEMAQIAAGSFGEYMIVDSDAGAVRAPILQAVGALVVSIKPDGCRIYPGDLAPAWDHWCALHAWWVARRKETLAIGKPWAPGTTKSTAKAAKVKPVAKPVVAMPDEGPTVDVDALRMRYVALDAASVSWVGEITNQALQAGLPIHLKDHLTARRARILDGLVTLAEADADDDDAVRALCRHILDDDAVEWPTVPVGAVVGRLSATSAATFAAACEMFAAGRFGLTFQLDGPTLSEVAA